MDFREIGDRIGTEAITEQIVQGKKFNEDLKGALPDEAQGTALQILMARIMGTAVAEHTVGYGGKVSVAPNTGDGLDLEELCVVMQVNEAGEFVAIWWKVGAEPTAWVNLSGTTDDHLVKASSSDEIPGPLDAKEASGVGIHQEVKTIDGEQKLETSSLGYVAVSAGDVPDVLENRLEVIEPLTRTLQGTEADRKMVLGVKLPNPEVDGKYLYTARIKDPLDYGQVVACYLGPHTKGGNNPMFVGWTQPEPGVFVRTETGAIPPAWLDGVDTRADDATLKAPSPLLGMRFLAYYQGDTSELGTEEPLQQVLILEDAGAHWEPTPGHPETLMLVNTQARFRRAPGFTESSQYVNGMTFGVQTGNLYGAGFLTLANSSITLGTTALVWDLDPGPTHDWDYKYELLSSTELNTENVDTSNADASVTMASGNPGTPAVAYLEHEFMTLPGTPGIVKLAAGPQEFHFEQVSLSASDVTGVTRILARVIITDAAGTTSVTELDPIPSGLLTPNVTVQDLVVPYRVPADIDMTTVMRFSLQIGISTTCQTPATLTVRINSQNHGTYWKGTFQVPAGGGTNSHPDLLNRNVDGADGRGQHDSHTVMVDDQAAFTGLLTGALRLDEALAMLDRPSFRWRKDGWGVATVDAAGLVSIPEPYTKGRLSLTGPISINGLDPTNWLDGQEATLLIQASVDNVATLAHFAPDLATNARLSLSRGDGAQFARYALLRLVLDTGATHSWLSEAETMVF
jgi:hypothetical protein